MSTTYAQIKLTAGYNDYSERTYTFGKYRESDSVLTGLKANVIQFNDEIADWSGSEAYRQLIEYSVSPNGTLDSLVKFNAAEIITTDITEVYTGSNAILALINRNNQTNGEGE